MTSPWAYAPGNRAGRWLADAGFPGAFLLFFIVLLLLNLSWVWNPPHWDEILGLHNQAVFLAKHHFSFAELWAEGQHSFEGRTSTASEFFRWRTEFFTAFCRRRRFI